MMYSTQDSQHKIRILETVEDCQEENIRIASTVNIDRCYRMTVFKLIKMDYSIHTRNLFFFYQLFQKDDFVDFVLFGAPMHHQWYNWTF